MSSPSLRYLSKLGKTPPAVVLPGKPKEKKKILIRKKAVLKNPASLPRQKEKNDYSI